MHKNDNLFYFPFFYCFIEKVEKSAEHKEEESKFENSVVQYLKKNGRQVVAQLAGKVKKPEGLKDVKYLAFLKERASLFNIEGQMVSLVNP